MKKRRWIFCNCKKQKRHLLKYSKKTALAYQKFLSRQSILNHNGHASATTDEEQKGVIDATSNAVQYVLIGSGIATSDDLG
ncbi:MAG: hypothetical protein C4329_06495 [Chitinophagaceae bacterium]